MNDQFCNFSVKEKKALENIFNVSFKMNTDGYNELFAAYDDFQSYYYNNEPKKGRSRYQLMAREAFLPQTKDEKFSVKYKDSVQYQIGIDLPVLINPAENVTHKGTIFFVAEDPLRPPPTEVEKNELNRKNDIVLSMPFGVHIEQARKNRLKVYWQVFERLLNDGYSIYATDIYKIWMKQIGSRSKEKIPNDLIEAFKNSLQEEVNWLTPSLIVCYGNRAFDAANHLSLKTENILFPHPSGSANGKWKRDMGKADDQFKKDYIYSKIKETIN